MSKRNTNKGIYCGFEVREPSFDPNECVLNSEWTSAKSTYMYTGEGHLITIGPNGSGKTRSLLVLNLIELTNWSTVVIDPKGELAVWTAKHRKDAGSEIVTFDPFGVIERRYPGLVQELPYLKSRGMNTIAMLNPESDDFSDDANLIGEALIHVDRHESHWGESARALVSGLVMALRMTNKNDGASNSLAELRQILGMAPDAIGNYLEGVIKTTQSEPAIAAKLNRFTEISPENRELFSILSTAVTQTNWMDSKPLQRELSGVAFDFAEMKRRPVTVYLILPPRFLETHSSWLRLMITAVLTPLIRSPDQRVPVLLMLDEFAALGRLEVIERNMPLMRGYGIKLWIILQDLVQLKEVYKVRWESFIANAGIIQSFAPNDISTRDYLAILSGKRLYWVWSNSNSNSNTSNADWSTSKSQSYQNTRTYYQDFVYTAHELAQMKRGQSVLYEYRLPPRRILLPDPSQLNSGNMLAQAEAFASSCAKKECAQSKSLSS